MAKANAENATTRRPHPNTAKKLAADGEHRSNRAVVGLAQCPLLALSRHIALQHGCPVTGCGLNGSTQH